MKIHTPLAIFALLVISCTCLLEHQAGKYDWSIKNAGEIDTVLMTPSDIYFTLANDDYAIGAFSTANGNLQYLRKEKHRILNKNDLKTETITYNEKQNSLSVFRMQKGEYVRNHHLPTQTPIIMVAFFENDNGIVILTENELIYESPDRKRSSIMKAEEGEVFWKLFMRKDEVFVGRHNKAKKSVCLVKILVREFYRSSANKEEKCFKITSDFNQKKAFLHADEFFLYEESLENSHVIFLPQFAYRQIESPTNYKITASIYIENSNIRVFEEKESYHFFELFYESSNYRKLYSLKKQSSTKFSFALARGIQGVSKGVLILYTSKGDFFIEVLNLENNEIKEVFSKNLNKDVGNVKRFWLGFSESAADDFNVLVQTESLNTFLFSKKARDIKWDRDDSLSEIVSSHFVNYQDIAELHINDYYESLEKHGTHSIHHVVQNFFFRVKSEFEELLTYYRGLYSKLVILYNKITDFQNFKANLQILNQGLDDQTYDITYALRKMIIVHTKYNTVFGLDSKRGEIQWRVYLRDPNFLIKGIYTIEAREEDVISHTVLIVSYSEVDRMIKFISIDPLTGRQLRVDTKESIKLRKIVKLPSTKDSHNEALLLIDEKFAIHLYPSNLMDHYKEKLSKFSFYLLDEETKVISGYKIYQNIHITSWSITLSANEEIIAFKSLSSNDPDALSSSLNGYRIAIPEDKKVLYMNVDFNNFAVLTKISKGGQNNLRTLNLYIINGIYGRILFNHYVTDVNFNYPINMIYDDNAVFVTYFNKMALGYELWVVESYLEKMETSFVPILEKFYWKSDEFNGINYSNLNLDFRYLEQKYGITAGVKYLTAFKSKYKLTRKNLLIVTSKNQILSLDRNLVSTRRSFKIDNKPVIETPNSLESVELPPYKYNIPINPMNYLTYHLNLEDIRKIELSPTNLESTSLLLAFGRDIFFTRLAPENSFDKLNEDFNFFYLIATVVTMIAVTMIMRHLAKKAKINEVFNR